MALSITKSKDRYGKTTYCVGDAYFYTEAKALRRLAALGGRERKAAPKVTYSEDIKRGYFIDKYGVKRHYDDPEVAKYLELRANPRRFRKGATRLTEKKFANRNAVAIAQAKEYVRRGVARDMIEALQIVQAEKYDLSSRIRRNR